MIDKKKLQQVYLFYMFSIYSMNIYIVCDLVYNGNQIQRMKL